MVKAKIVFGVVRDAEKALKKEVKRMEQEKWYVIVHRPFVLLIDSTSDIFKCGKRNEYGIDLKSLLLKINAE